MPRRIFGRIVRVPKIFLPSTRNTGIFTKRKKLGKLRKLRKLKKLKQIAFDRRRNILQSQSRYVISGSVLFFRSGLARPIETSFLISRGVGKTPSSFKRRYHTRAIIRFRSSSLSLSKDGGDKKNNLFDPDVNDRLPAQDNDSTIFLLKSNRRRTCQYRLQLTLFFSFFSSEIFNLIRFYVGKQAINYSTDCRHVFLSPVHVRRPNRKQQRPLSLAKNQPLQSRFLHPSFNLIYRIIIGRFIAGRK